MAFKEGNKVVIVKSLGEKNGQSSGDYYYGGSVSVMPLKSKGTIIDFDGSDSIEVEFENGKTWHLHPSEIQLVRKATSTSKLGKLPDSYAFKVAFQTPVFLLNDRMYVLDETQPTESAGVFQRTRDGKTERHCLVESATLSSLEELTYQHHLKDFDGAERKYLGEVIEQREEQTSGENERYRLVDLIVNEVFPHFRGDGSGNPRLEKLLGVKGVAKESHVASRKNKTTSSKINAFVSKLIKGIEKERFGGDGGKQRRVTRLDSLLGYEPGTEVAVSELPRDYNPYSLLGRILDGKNAAIIDGVVYHLSQSKNSQNGQSLTFDGKTYALVSPRPVSEVTERYGFELSKQVRINVLRTKLANDKRIQELELKDASLRGLVRKKEHKEGDFGFIREDKGESNPSYFVFLKVPKYVLRLAAEDVNDPDYYYDEAEKECTADRFYFFKPVRVATRVSLQGDDITFDEPVTVEAYDHPFTGNAGEYCSICLEEYNFDKLYEGDLKRGEAVAKLLVDTKHVLMSGYLDGDTTGISRLEEYEKNRIYPGEIKRRNLYVSNVKLASRGSRK